MTTNNETVGFIGLGIMGLPMARNVLKGGYPVVAWNRTASKVDLVADAGAERGESPSDVAARSTVIVTCVRASEDVEQVVFGQPGVPGIIDGVRPGSVVIDMSTISPAVTRQVAAKLAEKDVAFIDAPISGGEQGAISGTLSIMCGGPAEALDRVRPVLETMGKRITHCGDSGAGQTVKLCNQIAVVLNNLAMAEALVFCQRSGVDPSVMLEAIAFGAAGSWQISNLGPKVVERDFSPGFKVGLQQKDLRLALDAADQLDLPLAGTSLVHQLFRAVEHRDGPDIGTQALVRALEALSGDEVHSDRKPEL
ncbi:MAG: NAD(P)-dependent oxidoreductase [Dehalococcoidia bacterium]|nr:NAD(P)-dependent oxidoreductase [Dehalococcoidia bacterium]MCA9851896.1 NAD(P)-dependent oxidoreductase [Dehalococcoidia bacterium]